MAPPSEEPKNAVDSIARKYGFERISNVKMDDAIPVSKYRSSHTGLTVCLADVDGPLVHGYFCIATETQDDDGLPHTLEHLIFLGSELYPYKGVLDLLANRFLASGTNAWTDTDHTCYTLKNAGSEGFLNLMPVYLDHILYPMLTKYAYSTEVHHVNGEGEDAGVVYSEVQGKENTGEVLAHLAMLRAMYPGVCGYKYETAGIMKNLRESTNLEKVRAYHQAYYRPENLCLVIAGKVNEENVFKSLKPVEGRILSKGERSNFARPWQGPVPPLRETSSQWIPYACDNEDYGLVYIAWRGSKASNLYQYHALSILLDYLTDTSIAPLQSAFVEIPDPYCSKVNYSYIENSDACFYLIFENVPKPKLTSIKDKLFQQLEGIVGKENIDMDRMKTVINRKILGILNGLESNPHEMIAMHMIGDFLYGNSDMDFHDRLNPIRQLQNLMYEDLDHWVTLIQLFFLLPKHVVTIGEPSKVLVTTMIEEEKNRLNKQKDSVGPEGLKQKAEELSKAIEENELPPPDFLLSNIPTPSIENIPFHSVHRSSNYSSKAPDDNMHFPLSALPLRFQLDDLQSGFVQIFALLDSTAVPAHLRLLLPLYLECILETPVFRDASTMLSHEEVVKELNEDVVNLTTSLGISECCPRFSCGPYAQVLTLLLKVEYTKYTRAVRWVSDLLMHTQFTPDRIKVIATKMLNDVSQQKRRGSKITETVIQNLCFKKDSNRQVNGMLRQHSLLTSILQRLEQNPGKVMADLEEVRSIVTKEKNIIIHMSTNVQRLASFGDPGKPWMEYFGDCKLSNFSLGTVSTPCSNLLNRHPGQGVIAGVGSVESAFMVQCVPCIDSFTDPDYPAILVYLQYLTQTEGPMWKKIRGLGFAYGYNLILRPSEGLMYLTLYKSSQVVSAYKEACKIVESYTTGKEKLDPVLLESARSSLLFELIEKEKSVADLALQSLLLYFKGTDQYFTKNLLKQIMTVGEDDLRRVGEVYVKPISDPAKTWAAVCCHPGKVSDVAVGFKEFSREFTIIPCIEESFLSSIEVK